MMNFIRQNRLKDEKFELNEAEIQQRETMRVLYNDKADCKELVLLLFRNLAYASGIHGFQVQSW